MSENQQNSNIDGNAAFRVKADRVEQSDFIARALTRTEISSNYQSPVCLGEYPTSKTTQLEPSEKYWKLSSDISPYPSFKSEQILVDALYNLSLEEIKLNIESNLTFRTGEKWDGVWTRDISYSILLGLGFLEPEVSKNSLRKKVKAGKIIQDTGTGGAYPVSSDRIVWALAAFEIFQVTGDQAWLEEIYPIISQSLADDLKNVYDPTTGLVKGESSFLDWREQSYPHWMHPVDIHESLSLGTNAVHYQANKILAKIARQLEDKQLAKAHDALAEELRLSINNKLWLSEKGYYGQYLYGKNPKILSPRAEALGEALCVLFGIADEQEQEQIVAQTPVGIFGIPSIFPQIPHIPPYHNDGVWPFVQAFWSLASAKVGNEKALTDSFDAIYRAAALFLTNKENFVAHSGDCAGTQINSDRQLWSVAGNLGMVYKVFFGLGFENDQLTFSPFIPQKYAGTKLLQGFKIRKAILDLEIEGYGNKIQTIILDGKSLDKPQIPLTLEGRHEVKIILSNVVGNKGNSNSQKIRFSPSTPNVTRENNLLQWDKQDDIDKYKILRNGDVLDFTDQNQWQLKNEIYGDFQVIAINSLGDESFASEPISVIAADRMQLLDLTEFAGPIHAVYEGYQGEGYIEISTTVNTSVFFSVVIPEGGKYALDFVYSNGNGPLNTGNSCAMRALFLEGAFVGTIVLPQRGLGLWTEWGRSNAIQVALRKGKNEFKLSLEPFTENMNIEVNQAMLDQVRILKV